MLFPGSGVGEQLDPERIRPPRLRMAPPQDSLGFCRAGLSIAVRRVSAALLVQSV